MTLSKNAFRSRLILARKLPHGQIVDQDKRLVWTSLQLKSLSFPVLVGFYFVFYFFVWFSLNLDLFPSDTIGFSYLVDFAILLFFFVGHPSFLSFRHIFASHHLFLYIFLLVIFFFPSWKTKIVWWV